MIKGLRSTWLAGGGALLLILSVSGIAAGATLVADTAETVVAAEPPEGTTDTSLTFEDIDGNGIDDDCQDLAAVANAEAVAATLLAVDLDGDGTVSVSEAARSDWIGGPNCNHGGYVSWVAQGSDDGCDPAVAEEPVAPTVTPVVLTENTEDAEDDEAPACDEAPAETTEEEADAEDAVCEATTEEPPAEEETPADTAPNAHGKAVSAVAQSDAVGGKNCNHGGAVSQAAKDKDHGNAAAKANGKGHGKAHGKGKGGPH